MDERFGIACRKKTAWKNSIFFSTSSGVILKLEFGGQGSHNFEKNRASKSSELLPVCVAGKTCAKGQKWAILMISGRRDFQPRNLLIKRWWAELDSNQRRRKPADLQSAPFGHFGIYPFTESPAGNATGLRERIHVGRARWI